MDKEAHMRKCPKCQGRGIRALAGEDVLACVECDTLFHAYARADVRDSVDDLPTKKTPAMTKGKSKTK